MNKQTQLAEIHHSGKPYIIYKSKKGFDLYTNFSRKIILNNKNIYNFLNRKWYFDRVYNQLIGQQSLNISYNFSYKSLDRGIIEKLGPSGIVTSVKYFIKQFNKNKYKLRNLL